MPIRLQELRVPAITGMVDTLAPEADADPTKAFLLLNCFRHRDGRSAVLRGGWGRVATTVLNAQTSSGMSAWVGDYIQATGTVIPVVISGGSVYQIGVGTVTEMLNTTDFTAAGITLATNGTNNAVNFAGKLVVTDGKNTPWMWDGTSHGGLTKLTNAPVSYGSPTVYYARLFWITAADRTLIQWSEVNSANTGYLAGGFNNQWALIQTGADALCALGGTNEGLYYWRTQGIGVIRGAVTATFSADGTHDGISGGVGMLTSGSGGGNFPPQTRHPFYHNGDFWFCDQMNRPWRLRSGGQFQPIWQAFQRFGTRLPAAGPGIDTDTLKPFNLGENTAGAAPFSIVTWDPLLDHIIMAGDTGVVGNASALRFNASSGELVGIDLWGDWVGGLGYSAYTQKVYGLSGSQIVGILGFSNTSTPFYGADQDTASTQITYSGTIIGPAQGYGETHEWAFDEIDVVFEGNGTDSAASLKVDYLTDREHYSTLMAAQQSVTAYDAAYQVKEQRARFGINGNGSWIRVRVQMSSTGRLAVKGWTVKAFATSRETVVVS